MSIDIKELLSEIQPLLQTKAKMTLIDKRISTHNDTLKGLITMKSKLENDFDDADLMDKLEAWADGLPKNIVKNADIHRLLTALEYLNK